MQKQSACQSYPLKRRALRAGGEEAPRRNYGAPGKGYPPQQIEPPPSPTPISPATVTALTDVGGVLAHSGSPQRIKPGGLHENHINRDQGRRRLHRRPHPALTPAAGARGRGGRVG